MVSKAAEHHPPCPCGRELADECMCGRPWPGWTGVRYGPNHHKRVSDDSHGAREEVEEE